jgi:type VI secretion system secreted protein VgrG
MSALPTDTAGRTAIEPIGQQGQASSPLLYLHCGIGLSGNRWLADETFRLLSFEGQESVSEPFDFQLQLRGNTDPKLNPPLTFDALVGRPVTVGLNRPVEGQAPDAAARFAQALRSGSAPSMSFYNGIVGSFAMDEPGVYRVGMKPALWRLNLTNRYEVHAQMSVRDVIADLMRKHYIDYSLDAVSGEDNIAIARVQDWLQAGESDYEFLRRIMSKAHIYYYFKHTGNGHTVVFANRPAYLQAFDRPLRYTYTALDELGMQQDDVVFQYSYQQSLTSTGVSGRFAHQENAPDEDPIPTFQTFGAFTPADPGELPFNQYRTYQYGMSSGTVREYVRTTASTLAASGRQLTGSSTCAGFRVGTQFTMRGDMAEGTAPAPVRPSLENKAFVLSKVTHQATADGGYTNQFESTDAAAMLTAFSVQDTQQGGILAKVVDMAGRGPTDWRYYEPANFDPATSRLRDSQAAPPNLMAKGVYVQFSSPGAATGPVWVKLSASMNTVPEIGATVLVTRASDESELPEVQQLIAPNGSLVVTPSGWTANTHVGSNYSTSYGDGQSIRYGLHSAYNLDHAVSIVNGAYESGQYRDTSFSQGASYSYSTSENGAEGLLSRSYSYGSTYNTMEAAVTWSKSTIGDSTSYSTVTGDTYAEDTVEGTSTRITTQNIVNGVTTTAMQSNLTTTGISNGVETVGMSTTMSSTGRSAAVSLTGLADQLSLTGVRTETSLTASSDSTNVTGISEQVSATGSSSVISVTGTSSQTNVTGLSTNINVTGSSTGINVTGSSTEIGVTGSTTRMNVTGASTGITVTGDSTEVGVTGSETRMSIHGSSSSVDITGVGTSVTIAGARISMEIVGLSVSIPVIYIYV